LKQGRPVNPTSARQQRLAELEKKRSNGELKRGRPFKAKIVEGAINDGQVALK